MNSGSVCLVGAISSCIDDQYGPGLCSSKDRVTMIFLKDLSSQDYLPIYRFSQKQHIDSDFPIPQIFRCCYVRIFVIYLKAEGFFMCGVMKQAIH